MDARLAVLGLALAAGVRVFVVQAFSIPSGSMEDTLRPGDRVLVEKATPRWRAVRRGDAVMFRFPSDDPAELHCTGPMAGKDFLKRVVGLPGDRVELRDAVLYLNGAPAAEPYAKRLDLKPCAKPPVTLGPAATQKAWEERRLEMELGQGLRDHFGPVSVPPGSYFVLGDNRDSSCDSRFWGPVPVGKVKGRAVLVYWPPSRAGSVK